MQASNNEMKAVTYNHYGPPEVLKLKTVPRPVIGENEILIRVKAVAVNSADARLRKADPFMIRFFFGFFKPKMRILGGDFAGVVEEAGDGVKEFQPGDRVYGSAFESGFGAYAEYVKVKAGSTIVKMPENLSFEKAAAVFFGGQAALHFLRKSNIQKGQKVLIYGASGSLGTHAVQLARYFGATVHGISSGKNASLVRSLGAEKVFDYKKEDFSRSGEKYDIIFDTIGKSPFNRSVSALKNSGKYARAVHMSVMDNLRGLWTGLISKKKVIGGIVEEKVEDLAFLGSLIRKGHLDPVVDKTYPLGKMVDAHHYVETGRKVGHVIAITGN